MTRIFRHYRPKPVAVAVLVTMALVLSVSRAVSAPLSFAQVNLVTDDKSIHPDAVIQDPHLVNAWGVSFNPAGSPFWVSDNGTGLATLYRVDPTTNAPTKQGLEVTIPGAGNPTGQAFNTDTVAGAFNQDPFLFVSEDGTVSGWRGALGTNAETLVPGSLDNVYKGAAFATVVGHSYLYAANFRAGTIDIVKGDAAAPDLTGNFTDPNLPSGFAPFNIRNLDGTLYVTYAQQDATKHDDVAGVGHGIVDAFDLNGNLLKRIGTQGTQIPFRADGSPKTAPPSNLNAGAQNESVIVERTSPSIQRFVSRPNQGLHSPLLKQSTIGNILIGLSKKYGLESMTQSGNVYWFYDSQKQLALGNKAQRLLACSKTSRLWSICASANARSFGVYFGKF